MVFWESFHLDIEIVLWEEALWESEIDSEGKEMGFLLLYFLGKMVW